MQSISKGLAAFIVKTQFSDLPEDVIYEIKRLLLDSIGCCFDGLSGKIGRISAELANRLGGPRESTIIGTSDKVSCANAAFANGQTMNAHDYDTYASLHDTYTTVPASLALVESVKASGKDLIVALALGQEISTRILLAVGGEEPGLGVWMSPIRSGPNRGKIQWPSVYGHAHATLGAVAAAGKVAGLDEGEMVNAIGIAAYICPPNILCRWTQNTPALMTKYGIGGWGAQAGVTSTLLAEMGFTGDHGALDGEYGFWKYTGNQEWTAQRAVAELGTKWLHKVTYKHYPAGGIMQSQLRLFAGIMEENNLQPEDIQKIKVIGPPVLKFPLWAENKCTTAEDCCWNISYHNALIANGIDLKHWHDAGMKDIPQIREFIKRVEWDVSYDEAEWGQAKLKDPAAAPVHITVITKEKTFEAKLNDPKKIRMTDEQLIDKFKENASSIMASKRAERIVQTVLELEKLENAAKLLEMAAI